MKYMFGHCSSLLNLPDISNWKTHKVTDFSGIFNGCESLVSLPDISKWNTSNAINVSRMFLLCKSITFLFISINILF